MRPADRFRQLRARTAAAWRDERGLSSTVQVVVFFPLTAGLTLIGVQTALWQHARNSAADYANQTAALVATGQLTASAADTRLTMLLDDHPDLSNSSVTVTMTAEQVTVNVAADAPGMIAGTRTRVTVNSATPTEGWQPLP